MFKFKTQDVPWETDYFESHVSNNHICPANENIYNALMSLKDGIFYVGYTTDLQRRLDEHFQGRNTSTALQEALNAFLRSHRVLTVHREYVGQGDNTFAVTPPGGCHGCS